jgi:hypothetical protein
MRKDLTRLDRAVLGVALVIGAGIFAVTASTTGDITDPASPDLVRDRRRDLRARDVVLRGRRRPDPAGCGRAAKLFRATVGL